MTTPRRIQLRHSKGWRLPAGATVVARPTRWGNPFRVGDRVPDELGGGTVRDRAHAVDLYREHLGRHPELAAAARDELAGQDLACWCPLDGPCHADLLLRAANDTEPGRT